MNNALQKSWTTIFLIDADPSIGQQAKTMFNEITSLEVNRNVNFIICLSAPRRFVAELDPNYIIPEGSSPDVDTTVFYTIKNKKTSDELNGSQLEFINEEKAFNIRCSGDIIRYFKSYALNMFPADEYVLFTWGHGAAYGLFLNGGLPNQGPTNHPEPEAFNMLSVEQLKNAILHAFVENDKKISLVILADCYMQFLDTAVTLLNANVDYMVAVETGIDAVGYNYYELFDALYKNTNITPKEFAELAVTSLMHAKNISIPASAVFADYLRPFHRLVGLLNNLGNALSSEIITGNNIEKIKNARSQQDDDLAFVYELIDLFRFLIALKNEFGPSWKMTGLINEILTIKKEIILQSFIGSELSKNLPHESELGCSICMPSGDLMSHTNLFYNTYILHGNEGYNSTAGLLSEWNKFIKTYIDKAEINFQLKSLLLT